VGAFFLLCPGVFRAFCSGRFVVRLRPLRLGVSARGFLFLPFTFLLLSSLLSAFFRLAFDGATELRANDDSPLRPWADDLAVRTRADDDLALRPWADDLGPRMWLGEDSGARWNWA
jgi:hypothetical protein